MKDYEAKIKLSLIQYLLQNDNKQAIIATEVPINQTQNIVDVLQISPMISCAFEIKSDKDNFSRLSKQLQSYSSVFNYVSVVVSENNYKAILPLLPKKIGIVLVTGSNITVKRKAMEIKRLSKIALAKIIWKNNILKIMSNKFATNRLKYLSDYELRKLFIKHYNLEEIRVYAYNFLMQKYQTSFTNFQKNLGAYIHEDDLVELNIQNTNFKNIT
ncbi:MAG: sce7726 family protein [Alphaproteobacteria bacterium]|nr:sce7726 family protein [Alphaproteobacteria bacterium]